MPELSSLIQNIIKSSWHEYLKRGILFTRPYIKLFSPESLCCVSDTKVQETYPDTSVHTGTIFTIESHLEMKSMSSLISKFYGLVEISCHIAYMQHLEIKT